MAILETTSINRDKLKSQFALPEGIYLLNHSVGGQPVAAQAAIGKFLASWQNQGARAWKEWLGNLSNFNQSLAQLLNTKPEYLCPQANVTQALANILSALPSGRKKIVLSELDFPSLGYLLQQHDFELHWIKADEFLNPEAWAQAIDQQTLAVLATHVISFNSYRAPVTEIIQCAKDKQAISVIDVAQAVGVVPIDAHAWQSDFIIGTCAKWLCGGPGAGWLWMNPNGLKTYFPKNIGWFAHEAPFEMDIYDFRHAKSAARFFGGTPPILPYVAATEGVNLINQIGIETIFQHNQALTQHMVENLQQQGKTILTPVNPAQRGGTICIEVDKPQALIQALNDHNIYFDVRKNKILRLSPHIYNDFNEVSQTLEILEKF